MVYPASAKMPGELAYEMQSLVDHGLSLLLGRHGDGQSEAERVGAKSVKSRVKRHELKRKACCLWAVTSGANFFIPVSLFPHQYSVGDHRGSIIRLLGRQNQGGPHEALSVARDRIAL